MQHQEEKGLIAWFTYNSVAANLLMIGLLLTGTVSAWTMRKEFFPEFSRNIITVRVPYLGAAPEEVENGVCIKIEEAIQDLEGIEEMISTAREGYGSIDIEVEQGYEPQQLLDEVKVRVDAISTFPEETERPVYYEQTTKDEVVWVRLYGEMDERSLKELGRHIRDELIAQPGITQAEMRGFRGYEITIELPEETMREYGLTFNDLVTAVRRSSIDLPAGLIKTPGGEVLLRTKGQAYTAGDFENITIITREDGTRLRIGDIATVNDGFDDYEYFSKFNGKPSIGIQVFRVGEQSTLDVTNAVKEYIEAKTPTLPEGVSLGLANDKSIPLRGRINLMVKNAAMGAGLVFLSLTLFLRFRVAFWVMAGLPVCFAGTLIMMPLDFVDVSINMLSLFGFILVLGIVVDDAIVIGENIFTTIKRDGQSIDNVIKGAKEVAMPATFGVLTTVAAFMPMLFLPGTQGKIWSGIAMVVVLCLLFSLVESKLILPNHLAHMYKESKRPERLNIFARLQRRVSDGLELAVLKFYRPMLHFALDHRYTTTAIFLACVIGAFGLIKADIVRWVYFPNFPADTMRGSLVMAEGTPAAVTFQQAQRIEDAAWATNEYFKENGYPDGVVDSVRSRSRTEDSAAFSVELIPSEDRPNLSGEVFASKWRELTGPIAGARELRLTGTFTGGGGGGRSSPIDIQLSGDNYDELDEVANLVKVELARFAGVFDVEDSFSKGKEEIKLFIKPEAETLGLTLSDLARQVRQAFYGAEAQRIQRGPDEVKVMIRFPRDQRQSLGNLENMRIRTPDGTEIAFSSVAEAKLGRGYSTIRRIDRKRVVNVTADLNKDEFEPEPIVTALDEEILPRILANYPGVNYEFVGEIREQRESLGNLLKGAVFTLVVIFALMAIPLKSYVKPLIIMSVIPFGMVGAVLGHLVMGLPISILSICGIIALSGVVVNDSLVMVDFINKREEAGFPRHSAVREAGVARFRAIILTSLTTFVGLVPMLLEKSLQAQFLIPMAASLGFGILFATVITLFLVPSLYLIVDDVRLLLFLPSEEEESQSEFDSVSTTGGALARTAVESRSSEP